MSRRSARVSVRPVPCQNGPDESLFKLVDENGVILGGAILFCQGDTLNVGRIFIDPQHFRKGYGIFMMREIERMFPEVKVFTLDTPVWNTRRMARR